MPDKTLIAIATTTAQESVERAAMMSSEHAGCTFASRTSSPMFWTAKHEQRFIYYRRRPRCATHSGVFAGPGETCAGDRPSSNPRGAFDAVKSDQQHETCATFEVIREHKPDHKQAR
jgi:hypothetical protein